MKEVPHTHACTHANTCTHIDTICLCKYLTVMQRELSENFRKLGLPISILHSQHLKDHIHFHLRQLPHRD